MIIGAEFCRFVFFPPPAHRPDFEGNPVFSNFFDSIFLRPKRQVGLRWGCFASEIADKVHPIKAFHKGFLMIILHQCHLFSCKYVTLLQ
jgi:hypothetical protein